MLFVVDDDVDVDDYDYENYDVRMTMMFLSMVMIMMLYSLGSFFPRRNGQQSSMQSSLSPSSTGLSAHPRYQHRAFAH